MHSDSYRGLKPCTNGKDCPLKIECTERCMLNDALAAPSSEHRLSKPEDGASRTPECTPTMLTAGALAIVELYRGEGGWCGIKAAEEQARVTWNAMIAASSPLPEGDRSFRDLAHEAFLQLEYLHQRERKHSSTGAVLLRLSEKLGLPLDPESLDATHGEG
jgi:hypothetical protein